MKIDYKTLQVKHGTHGIWQLIIHRPEALNALNSEVLNELGDFLRSLGEMGFEDARALIISGSGKKAFVAGADIKTISELNQETALIFAQKGQAIFHELSLLQIPVIAAVNGFALGGGCELALACDFIYCSENSKFGLPEVSLGLIPGFGGTVRMARALGLARARELIFTGNIFSASEALQMGIVNKICKEEELIPNCMQVAERMTNLAPLAVAHAKKSINQAWDMEIEEAQKNEAAHFSLLFASEDVREGTSAFLEKRKPQFKGS